MRFDTKTGRSAFALAALLAACGSPSQDSSEADDTAAAGPKPIQVQAEQNDTLDTTARTFVFDGQKGWQVHYRMQAHDGAAVHFIPHIAVQEAAHPENVVFGASSAVGAGLGDISGLGDGVFVLPNTGKWVVTIRAATDEETQIVLKNANFSGDPHMFAKTGPFTLVLNVDLPCHHAGDDHHKNPDNCPNGLFCTQLKDGWDWSKDKGAPQCMP